MSCNTLNLEITTEQPIIIHEELYESKSKINLTGKKIQKTRKKYIYSITLNDPVQYFFLYKPPTRLSSGQGQETINNICIYKTNHEDYYAYMYNNENDKNKFIYKSLYTKNENVYDKKFMIDENFKNSEIKTPKSNETNIMVFKLVPQDGSTEKDPINNLEPDNKGGKKTKKRLKNKKSSKRIKKSKKYRGKLIKGGEEEDNKPQTDTVAADINTPDSEGNTPLHLACDKGNLTEVEELIAQGANVNAENYENDFDSGKATPLHFACGGVKIELVKILLENNADVNAIDQGGNTPLHRCFLEFLPIDQDNLEYAEMGTDNLKLVKLLVENGATVDAENYDHETPLYNALFMDEKCYTGDYMICFVESRINIAKYLIDNGANLENNKVKEPLNELNDFFASRYEKNTYKQELEVLSSLKNKKKGGKRKTKKIRRYRNK